jgi:hypothetical protein
MRFLLAASCVLVVLLQACDNASVPGPAAPGVRPVKEGNPTPPGAVRERPVIDRFSIEFAARGPFRPNEPFVVTAVVTANVPTELAQLRVVMPDAEISRSRGWAPLDEVPVGVPVHAAADVSQRLGEGDVLRRQVTLVVARPGVYLIGATARPLTTEPEEYKGQRIRDVAVREFWIVVNERGGRVLQRFDASTLPGDWDPRPGPARLRAASDVDAPDDVTAQIIIPCDDPNAPPPPDCYEPPPPPPPPPPFTVYIKYFNYDSYQYTPLVGVYYTVHDNVGGCCRLVKTGTTNSQGSFTVPCTSGAFIINVLSKSPGRVNVTRTSTGVTITLKNYGTTTNPCATSQTLELITDSQNDAHLFTSMRVAVDSSRSFFQRSRGEVNVRAEVPSTQSSYYSPSNDFIVIYQNDIWGTSGAFTTAHEYGHAFAQAALNGAREGGCPESGHRIDLPYTMLCALSEGWADYHAVITRGPNAQYYEGIRTNAYYSGGDGALVEGAVAAYMFDLTARPAISDVRNGYELALHYPGSFLADIMKNCVVGNYGVFLRRPMGADDLTYCLEQQIDSSVVNNYFQTQYPEWVPNYLQVNTAFPSNWSRAAVRRLWLNKLYGQGP